MPLENLLILIEKLRERIDFHGDALKKNEWLTRYALIDPLLRELGWDTEDPDIVRPEYVLDQKKKRPDYVLRNNGVPIMILEAKKLGESLSNARMQAANYAMADASVKARYFSTTNGSEWEIYDTNRPANDMMTAAFDLNKDSVADACLKALALWRPSVISGHIAVGETPIVGLSGNQLNTTDPQPTEDTTVQPPLPVLGEDGWRPLSVFNPQTGDPKPTEIFFPDNSRVSINTWKAILVEVARWLINNNILYADHCPIQGVGKAKRYLVSTTPTHLELKNKPLFKRGEQVGSLHIETNYSGPDCVENAQHIIQHGGQDLAQFRVRLP